MTKNILLNLGIIICKILYFSYAVIFAAFLVFFVHHQVKPSAYANIDVAIVTGTSQMFFARTKTYKDQIGDKVLEDSEVFVLNKLKKSSLYFNFVKFSLLVFLMFLVVKEFQKIIESVKEVRTFQKRNIKSFRKIGRYLLGIFVLVSYSSYIFEEGGTSSFCISLELLIFVLIAFIMSEIFEEGSKLWENSKLTI